MYVRVATASHSGKTTPVVTCSHNILPFPRKVMSGWRLHGGQPLSHEPIFLFSRWQQNCSPGQFCPNATLIHCEVALLPQTHRLVQVSVTIQLCIRPGSTARETLQINTGRYLSSRFILTTKTTRLFTSKFFTRERFGYKPDQFHLVSMESV